MSATKPFQKEELKKLWKRPNAVILIDNSNIWIQGKKTCGELQHLLGENPHWRINVGKLITVMLKEAGLPCSSTDEIDKSIAYGRLFGSIPPPDDSVWAQFRKHLDVDLTPRNKFTNKEKQVDAKFIQLATSDATGLYQQHEMGVSETVFDTRVYCLAAGDTDYCSTVQSILEFGLKVILFSWKNCLGVDFCNYERAYPELMKIVLLDSFIEEIGFEESVVDVNKYPIPAERSFYIVRPDAKSMASLGVKGSDCFEQFRDLVLSTHSIITHKLHVSSCRCIESNSSDTAAFVLNQTVTIDQLTELISHIRSVFETAGFPDSCVLSYPDFHNPKQALQHMRIFNQYSVLQIDDDESYEPPTPDAVVDTLKDDHTERFVVHSSKRPVTKQLSMVRCRNREFCPMIGNKCMFFHTLEEKQLFNRSLGKKPYCLLKKSLCTNKDCKKQRLPKECLFRHPGEEEFCPTCASLPCINRTTGKELCSETFERLLIDTTIVKKLRDKGYLKT
jgi:hypothetical protein